jgi:hypothetical protein
MKIVWLIVSSLCIIAAVLFLLRRDFNAAFVIAAIGVVSWFLNYRAQMKEITTAADLEQKNQREELNED